MAARRRATRAAHHQHITNITNLVPDDVSQADATMTADFDRLWALAEAVTPSQWWAEDDDTAPLDAKFIAAANPATILALRDRIAALIPRRDATVTADRLATEHAQLRRVALAASEYMAARDVYSDIYNDAYSDLRAALDDLPIHLIGFEVVA